MKNDPLRAMTRLEFLELARQAGFAISQADLYQLNRRMLVSPFEAGAGEEAERYNGLHLFALAAYFDGVRTYRHPWGATAPERTLDEVGRQCREICGVAEALLKGNGAAAGGDERRVAVLRELERYVQTIDPFGPLSEIVDLLRPSVVVRLRGVGRLHAELCRTATALAEVVEVGGVASAEEVPPTRPIAVEDVDAVIDEDDEESEVVLEDLAVVEEAAAPPVEVVGEADAGGGRSHGFGREEQMTARTRDLQERLNQLRQHDRQVAEARERPEEPQPEVLAEGKAEESAEAIDRIGELNRRRERYLQEGRWSELARLYEEGLELFDTAQQRQQVLLMLATLYEIKLGEKRKAFETFVRAHGAGGEGAEKALEGVHRLGKLEEVRPLYLAWIEERLGAVSGDEERCGLLKQQAFALKAEGEHHRAFLVYASMLAERPEQRVQHETLDDLERLGRAVEADEVEAFFQDILEQDVSDRVRALVAERAGRFLTAQGRAEAAAGYLRQVVRLRPEHELAFQSLVRLIEERGDWRGLIEVYEERIAQVDEDRAGALYRELEESLERGGAEPEAFLALFAKRVEREPQDERSLERLIGACEVGERFAEGYAFLNRLAQSVESAPTRVRVLKALAKIAVRNLHAPEEAAVHFEHALEIQGPDQEILEGLASARLGAEDWEGAVSAIRALTDGAAVELAAEERVQWLLRGAKAAEKSGRQADRQRFLQEVLVVEPEHPEAREALSIAP